MTSYLVEEINRVNLSKESPRHHELKDKLLAMLQKTEGITIAVKEQWQFDREKKRKPDVFCHYKNSRIAFEIQLSPISQKYIFFRYDFYKKLGIHLFWVLDDFAKNAQTQRERDIKYLNEYQNIFQIDENSKKDTAQFICNYKKPYIFNDEVYSPWTKESVGLPQLFFDNELFQPYFFDFPREYKKLENKCFELQLDKARKKDEEKKYLEWAQRRYDSLKQEKTILNRDLLEVEKKSRLLKDNVGRIEKEVEEKRKCLVSPDKELDRITSRDSRFYSVFKPFFNESEELRKLIALVVQNGEQVVNCRKKLLGFKEKKASIEGLSSVNIYGIQYQMIDHKKYKQYIIENEKRFIVVSKSSLNTDKPTIFKLKNKSELNKKLDDPFNSFAFLINLRQDISECQKQIENELKQIGKIEADSNEVKDEIRKNCLKWLEQEIEKLEQQKPSIELEIQSNEILQGEIKSKIIDIELQQQEFFEEN